MVDPPPGEGRLDGDERLVPGAGPEEVGEATADAREAEPVSPGHVCLVEGHAVYEHSVPLAAEREFGVDELQRHFGGRHRGERLDPPELGRRPVTHDELRLEQLHGPEPCGEVHRPPRLDPGPALNPGPPLRAQPPKERTPSPPGPQSPRDEQNTPSTSTSNSTRSMWLLSRKPRRSGFPVDNQVAAPGEMGDWQMCPSVGCWDLGKCVKGWDGSANCRAGHGVTGERGGPGDGAAGCGDGAGLFGSAPSVRLGVAAGGCPAGPRRFPAGSRVRGCRPVRGPCPGHASAAVAPPPRHRGRSPSG